MNSKTESYATQFHELNIVVSDSLHPISSYSAYAHESHDLVQLCPFVVWLTSVLLQRVSTAYMQPPYWLSSNNMSVRPSVRLSVTLW